MPRVKSIGAPQVDITDFSNLIRKVKEAEAIAATVKAAGGHVIALYPQGLPFFRKIWTRQYNSTGVCQALVNEWIVQHAKGGSLWNWLFMAKGLDEANAEEIGRRQAALSAGVAHDQANAMQQLRSQIYLGSNGIIRRRDIKSGQAVVFSAATSIAAPTGNDSLKGGDVGLGIALAHAIAHGGTANATEGQYRAIRYLSDMSKHIVCAWVQRDVAFYDPNFGEAYFENRDDFVTWFPTYFSRMGGYRVFTNYAITDYAMDARR